MANNPYGNTPSPGAPTVTQHMREVLRNAVDDYLANNAASAVVTDAQLAAVHPALGNAAVLALVKRDLGLA